MSTVTKDFFQPKLFYSITYLSRTTLYTPAGLNTNTANQDRKKSYEDTEKWRPARKVNDLLITTHNWRSYPFKTHPHTSRQTYVLMFTAYTSNSECTCRCCKHYNRNDLHLQRKSTETIPQHFPPHVIAHTWVNCTNYLSQCTSENLSLSVQAVDALGNNYQLLSMIVIKRVN